MLHHHNISFLLFFSLHLWLISSAFLLRFQLIKLFWFNYSPNSFCHFNANALSLSSCMANTIYRLLLFEWHKMNRKLLNTSHSTFPNRFLPTFQLVCAVCDSVAIPSPFWSLCQSTNWLLAHVPFRFRSNKIIDAFSMYVCVSVSLSLYLYLYLCVCAFIFTA